MPSTNKLSNTRLSVRGRVKIAHQLLILCGIITSFAIVITAFCLAHATHAESADSPASATAVITVNLDSGISVRTLNAGATSVIDTLSLELTPTPTGKFTKNTTIVDVATSNATGYNLYMTTDYEDIDSTTAQDPVYTNAMLNIDPTSIGADGKATATASSYTIPTIDPTVGGTVVADTITEAAFSAANTTSSPNTFVNNWAYSTNAKSITNSYGEDYTQAVITDVTDTSAIDYKPIPSHGTSNTIRDDITTAVDYSYTPVTIGVNVDTGIASGTYQNNLYFTAIGNALPINYSLTFNPNGSDSGNTGSTTPSDITVSTISNMPSTNPMTATSTASSYTFTLPSTAPETSAEGYVFKEWNTSPDGTGTSYAPGDDFQLVADSSLYDPGAKTIYAIWEIPLPVSPVFSNITYMQEMTTAICDAATTPSASATVSDTTGAHIGDTSYVPEATLVDYRGRDGTGTADNPVNDPSSSNYQTYVVRKLADGNCWMVENLQLNLSTTHSYKVGTLAGGEADWTPNQTSTNDAYNYAITPNYAENIAVTDYRGISHNNWYYPWHAAVAASSTTQTSYTPTQSICPKGWRLPLGGNNTGSKSFYYLITTKYGQSTSNAINNDPLNFYPAGYYSSGSLYDSVSGCYWSDTSSSSNSAYRLTFDSSYVYPQHSGSKYYGFSVRCVSL